MVTKGERKRGGRSENKRRGERDRVRVRSRGERKDGSRRREKEEKKEQGAGSIR